MRNNTTFALARGQLISFRFRARPPRITCLAGHIWATIDGNAADYVVAAGQSASFARGGTVVIQALSPATLRLEPTTEQPRLLAAYPPGSSTISNTPVAVP